MCGLTGFWKFKQESSETLNESVKAMSDKIQNRGPDSYGAWVSESQGMAIAHRRLSIIDLSEAGHQPMHSHNKRYVIAYNGEIYNSKEMADELRGIGVHFRGHSDTEVLLEACNAWGVERAVQKSNGMFAFVLWDSQEKRLILVRDRLGIKPLYWGFNQGLLFFGSEVGTFTRHKKWQAQLNAHALASYFNHNYIRGPESIYKNIKQLRPGTIVSINAEKQVKEQSYWSLDEVISRGKTLEGFSEQELKARLDTLLRDAVKKRMASDVPLGAFLSGGIDSSTVVALMQQQSSRPVKTFSIGFKESDFNEAQYASEVASHLGTEHYEHYFGAKDAIDLIPQLPTLYDEPFADSSQLPTYLVSQLAREQVTVCLSGDGGDELFGGYNRYLVANSLWTKLRLMPAPIRKLIALSINRLNPRQIELLAHSIPNKYRPAQIADKAYKLASILGVDRKLFYQRLVSLWQDEEVVNDINYKCNFPTSTTSLGFISEMQFIDTLTYLPDDILTKVDRASMATNLEARVPLLDYRVLEFAWSLPMKHKIHKGQGKTLLTKVLKQYVPAKLIDRPKMGFGVPIGEWIKGPLLEWAEDLLSERNLSHTGHLNTAPIRRCWQEHKTGVRNWQYPLWGALMFVAWQQQWLA